MRPISKFAIVGCITATIVAIVALINDTLTPGGLIGTRTTVTFTPAPTPPPLPKEYFSETSPSPPASDVDPNDIFLKYPPDYFGYSKGAALLVEGSVKFDDGSSGTWIATWDRGKIAKLDLKSSRKPVHRSNTAP